MSVEQAPAHVHDWQEIGGCSHPHATGLQGGNAYCCCSCGRYGHKITLYACGARQKRASDIAPPHCPLIDPEAWATWWRDIGKPEREARKALAAEAIANVRAERAAGAGATE